MRQLRPVVWSKGTFLTPQHLQTRDRYLEGTIQFQLEALNFQPWGFHELEIDQQALLAGTFAVKRAVGLFPDGLPFDIPDSDRAPAPKPLADHLQQDQEAIDVYVAIPQHRERGLNVAVEMRGADTRYISEVVNLCDENTGGTQKPVQLARKNLRFLVEGESREGCTSLRVARARRTAGGSLKIDPTFIPPLVNACANEPLRNITRRLVEILAAKSAILAGGRRQRSSNLADFTAADIGSFWLLYTVNSYLPVLRHFYETGKVHPERLFRILCGLAGSLSTFSLKIQPGDLPAYDHDELGACFADLDEKLRELLETVVPTNFVALPLKLVRTAVYATPLEEDKYFAGTKLYLAVGSSLPEIELAKKVPQLVKVCSATEIEHIVSMALPGLSLVHSPRPPSAIPVKLNFQYFSVNQTGAAWDGINRARSLAAFVPSDIADAQLELIILLPQT
jgi:type VI secretion system protein ImpJ